MFHDQRLLFWKNHIIRKRHWISSLFHVGIPILLFMLLYWGYSKALKPPSDGKKANRSNTIVDNHSNINLIRLPVNNMYIWYTPQNEFTEGIIKRIHQKQQIKSQGIKGFSNNLKLQKTLKTTGNNTVAAINFYLKDEKHLNYDLTLFEKGDIEKLLDRYRYISDGFVAMQMEISLAFFKAHAEKSNNSQQLSNVIFKILEIRITEDEFMENMKIQHALALIMAPGLPIITLFSFLFLISTTLKPIVDERASGIKELLKMSGIQPCTLWLSWYIHGLTLTIISIIVVVCILKFPLLGKLKYGPLQHTDFDVLFVFLLLYCIAIISFCLLVSSLFTRASFGLIVANILWIILYSVPVSFAKKMTKRKRVLFSISPNYALLSGYYAIVTSEIQSYALDKDYPGLSWKNLFEQYKEEQIATGLIPLGYIFIILLITSAVCFILAAYIDKINPGPYGIGEPFWHPISSLMKCCMTRRTPLHPTTVLKGTQISKCIEVIHISKKFGSKMVVNDLSFHVPCKRITVFLGHNGAGKSTTMSMMTGMIPVSSGIILVTGLNINYNLRKVQKLIGLCPQSDLLFPELTVSEHLLFFASLRGMPSAAADKETKYLIETVALKGKENSVPSELSGGMKRKLCLGIAAIGDCSILILDEPSSGVDPESRRKLWNLLLELRKTRTIFISTHFMDEADALADYIIIIGAGHKICDGEPLELKQRYETGYYLHLTLKPEATTANEIKRTLPKSFSKISFVRRNRNLLEFKLPFNWKDEYSDFLEYLEKRKDRWKIAFINLELTTLQDVFLKTRDKTLPTRKGQDYEPEMSFTRIFLALLYKKYIYIKNTYLSYLPALIIFIFIYGFVFLQKPSDETSEYLSTYNNELKVYYSGKNSSQIKYIKKHYKAEILALNGQPFEVNNVTEALLEAAKNSSAPYSKSMIIGANFEENNKAIIATSIFLSSAAYSIPITMNIITSAVAKTILNENYSITTNNVPLVPITNKLKEEERGGNLDIDYMLQWAIFLGIGIVIFMGNNILFTHAEISTEFMKLQFIYGVPPWLYWITCFIFDYFLFVIEICLIIFFWFAINRHGFFKMPEIEMLLLIFLLHGMGAIAFAYVFAYRPTFAGGFSLHVSLGITFGLALTGGYMALNVLNEEVYVSLLLYIGGFLSPQFTFTTSLLFWIYQLQMEDNRGNTSPPSLRFKLISGINSENRKVILLLMAPLLTYGLFLIFINSLLYKILKKRFLLLRAPKADEEEFKFKNPNDILNNQNVLVAKELRKSYGYCKPHVVVKNVSFGVKKQECFGLLGVNGAGKTTTFMMLTRTVLGEHGTVDILEHQEPVNNSTFQRNIGYSPQNSALNLNLTAQQTLFIFAQIRGYDRKSAMAVTKLLLEEFDLEQYKDQKCGTYSGGNLRKLSVSVAFLGKSKVILLDEPTSGVDPASRQRFWDTVLKFKNDFGRSFVLCSHSMEECEALCDRISILKDGRIACVGSLQDLQKQYQKGYKLSLKLDSKDVTIAKFQEEVNKLKIKFNNAKKIKFTLLDEYGDFLTYHLDVPDSIPLSQIFKKIQCVKQDHPIIEDYIITSMSLEDIFLTVANEPHTN